MHPNQRCHITIPHRALSNCNLFLKVLVFLLETNRGIYKNGVYNQVPYSQSSSAKSPKAILVLRTLRPSYDIFLSPHNFLLTLLSVSKLIVSNILQITPFMYIKDLIKPILPPRCPKIKKKCLNFYKNLPYALTASVGTHILSHLSTSISTS